VVGVVVKIAVDAKEAEVKITQVADDLSGQPMVDAVDEATALIEYTAEDIVPVVTGLLRSTIEREVITKGAADNPVTKGVVGSDLYYAPFVEARKPFLAPALEVNEVKVGKIIDAAVDRIVKE